MDLQFVQSSLERGFADVHRRLDELRDVQNQRHGENTDWLKTLDEEFSDLKDEFGNLRTTATTHTEQLNTLLRRETPVTRTGVTWVLGTAVALLTIIWTLHLLKVL